MSGKARRRRGCPKSGKTRFRSEGDARQAMKRTRRRETFAPRVESGETAQPAVRVYSCPWCGGWHLTSRPAR